MIVTVADLQAALPWVPVNSNAAIAGHRVSVNDYANAGDAWPRSSVRNRLRRASTWAAHEVGLAFADALRPPLLRIVAGLIVFDHRHPGASRFLLK
jgi:hypothetical protein